MSHINEINGNWLEIINKLRVELDHLESTLEAADYGDEVNLCVTKGFIANFTEALYPGLLE